MSNELHTKTIAQIRDDLKEKKYSSEEITKCYLDRIKNHDSKLNSFVTILEESALEKARQADLKISKGQTNLLTGVPIAHKDIFCTKGVKTSCGSKMLDNFISPYDATVVINLENAGTICLGKTNMDEFAMGSSNETSYYGPVSNPWDLERVPGGSSGGSSAAVSARIVPGATSTDTGGSIRQPASLCGITGLKPTYGRVSRFGMIAFASSLDQAGPMAQTAEDCALLLQGMAGYDKNDSTSVPKEVPDYTATLNDSIDGLKIGLPEEFFNDKLDSKIGAKVEESIKELEKLGAKFKKISIPSMDLSIPVYYVIAPAECSSNLSRYDGVRFGYRTKNPKNLEELYKKTRSEGFGAEVKRRIMIGTYVLSAGYYDAYYLKAQQVRRKISDDFNSAFKDVDVILGPTAPSVAFKKGEIKDPVAMYLSDMYTIGANMAGLPALSMPGGYVDNLPVGVQLIGKHFEEHKILNVAHKYQQETNWHFDLPSKF